MFTFYFYVYRKHSSHRNEHLDASANVIYDEVKTYADNRDRQHVVGSGPSQGNDGVTIRQVGQDLSGLSDITTSSNVVYGANLDGIATLSNAAYGAKVDNNIATSSNTAYGAKLGEVYEDPDDGYEMLDIEPMYDTCS